MTDFCNEACGICREINGLTSIQGYESIVREKNNIIAESDSFIIIPSIGPLNASHVMLVPKWHVNSFAALDDECKSESRKILSLLNEYSIKQFGFPLIFFESGAGETIDHSGGCIFHAHIHCVSYTRVFETALNKEIEFKSVGTHSSEYDVQGGYVWYMNPSYKEFLCNKPLLPSQFLRYLYSDSNLIRGSWNWRRDYNISGVLEVIEKYKGFKL
ncbi:HIT domain-containing protein [Pantoea alfalfae]|nr:HIT domain-containing protein [Pantoea alfalfae]